MDYVTSYLKPMFKSSNLFVNVDYDYTGCLNSWNVMLEKYTCLNEYRVHLQDDAILCHDLERYLPELIKEMEFNKMDFVSLFGVRKPAYNKAFVKGEKYTEIKNFYGLQACVMSPRAQRLMLMDKGKKPKSNKDDMDEMDDIFVRWSLRNNKITPMLHLPVLACHNLEMESTIEHSFTSTKKMVSNLFDMNYVRKKYEVNSEA